LIRILPASIVRTIWRFSRPGRIATGLPWAWSSHLVRSQPPRSNRRPGSAQTSQVQMERADASATASLMAILISAQSGALPIKTQAREFLFDLDNPQRASRRCGNRIRDAADGGLDQPAPAVAAGGPAWRGGLTVLREGEEAGVARDQWLDRQDSKARK
jgi:hypothetical protein